MRANWIRFCAKSAYYAYAACSLASHRRMCRRHLNVCINIYAVFPPKPSRAWSPFWGSLSPGECDKLRINYQYQCITEYKSHALAATECGLANGGRRVTTAQHGLAGSLLFLPARLGLSPLIRPSASAAIAVSNNGNTAANFRCRFYGTLPINIYLQCHNY